jgi:hypothetical protein
MNIGEEQEPIELPMPVDPNKIKREMPVPSQPVQEPAKEPAKQDAKQFAQELLGGKPLTEVQAEIMDQILVLAGRRVPPCPCECNSGGFCGGCGHAGCGGR